MRRRAPRAALGFPLTMAGLAGPGPVAVPGPPTALGRTVPAVAALAVATLGLAALPGSARAQEQRLSPLDSATAVVEGAEIEIQYGRPSVRGRTIFGQLVPFGRVWRTGANEATHLRSSAELRIGGATVPVGRYTLYTVPGAEEWTLVINRQIGQWGTEYHRDRDLARIPMRVERLEEPVETFTITVSEREEGGGILAMEWERTRAWVPFEVVDGEEASGEGGDSSP